MHASESIVMREVAALIPYARNSRTHDDAQVAQIAASIREFGFTNPVLIDGDGGIIAGHGRVMAARKLAMEVVPCIVLDYLTETQRKAYVIADNKLALNSGWDDALLKLELEELTDAGFDITLTGFSLEEFDEMDVEIEEVEGNTDPDDIPEPPTDPVTKLGDVWLLGKHRLMCGDSTSIDAVGELMAGSLAGVLFTDPPYGYRYVSNHQKKHEMLMNDDVLLDFMPAAYSAMKDDAAAFICGSHQTIHQWRAKVDEHFAYKNLIVWKKNNWSMGDLTGAFAGQHELIIFAHKGRVELRGGRARDVWEFDRDPPEHHPTQKPVELVEFAIGSVSDKGETVLDLFGGSGSTLIACEKTGRMARLMELDPKYCDVIVKRWQEFTGKQATLESDGRAFDEVSAGSTQP
ncbi:site-specific DNA-methyltransferase [Paraburkholderia bengalensis]|uniref:site-specific DNA-methyltransferase (adenine-specific) n=1 Tax=Paraburkholderia bengalensis TaxID=2747562 RepID=A0ABU8IRR8_9BURK